MASPNSTNNFDSISGQIAKILADRIIRGDLVPGQRILEQTISDELDVSRSPVREAFLSLEKQRLVEILPRRGARVADMSRDDIQSLYDLVTELYGLAASKSAESHTVEDLAKIRRTVENVRLFAEAGNPEKYYEAIFEFSLAALEVARNPLLTQTLADLNGLTRRAQFGTISKPVGDLAENAAFFERALDYVEKGNPDKAAQTIRAYVQNEKDFAMRLLLKNKE